MHAFGIEGSIIGLNNKKKPCVAFYRLCKHIYLARSLAKQQEEINFAKQMCYKAKIVFFRKC